jgi:hypothetical protein
LGELVFLSLFQTSAREGTNVEAIFQFAAAELDANAKVAKDAKDAKDAGAPPPPVVRIDSEPASRPKKTNECCI